MSYGRMDETMRKPYPKAQRNFTDPESRIQKTPDGFIQGYTAVLAVDQEASGMRKKAKEAG